MQSGPYVQCEFCISYRLVECSDAVHLLSVLSCFKLVDFNCILHLQSWVHLLVQFWGHPYLLQLHLHLLPAQAEVVLHLRTHFTLNWWHCTFITQTAFILFSSLTSYIFDFYCFVFPSIHRGAFHLCIVNVFIIHHTALDVTLMQPYMFGRTTLQTT